MVQQYTNTRTYGSKQWNRTARALTSDGVVWGDARLGMELVAVRRPVTTADELSPSRRTLVGDWELMAFEGPQRQRKKMIRSKRKLILARDRRGENTSDAVADGCVPEEGSGGDVAASTAVEVPPTVDEDSDVIVVHTAALSMTPPSVDRSTRTSTGIVSPGTLSRRTKKPIQRPIQHMPPSQQGVTTHK